ncbi:MAG TPA: AbrB/MazE/SpoVT family DNA-binding domain-containing protein, partial [Firmicutes bacterium]|nr:AbrB/MazE/SpoVT family DNA-binding domain-containing protein [Bacillota bacterium]
MEIRKIFRAGNSQVISLPHKVLKTLGLKEGDQVIIELEGDQSKNLVLRPLLSSLSLSREADNSLEEFIETYK